LRLFARDKKKIIDYEINNIYIICERLLIIISNRRLHPLPSCLCFLSLGSILRDSESLVETKHQLVCERKKQECVRIKSKRDEIDSLLRVYNRLETLRIARVYEVDVYVNPLPRVFRDWDYFSTIFKNVEHWTFLLTNTRDKSLKGRENFSKTFACNSHTSLLRSRQTGQFTFATLY